MAAARPKTKIARTAKPSLVAALEGPVPRLRQNRVSFSTRIWEYEVALARFNVPQPFVALVLSRHADIQTYASNPTTVLT
jgi:hypothetical protein